MKLVNNDEFEAEIEPIEDGAENALNLEKSDWINVYFDGITEVFSVPTSAILTFTPV